MILLGTVANISQVLHFIEWRNEFEFSYVIYKVFFSYMIQHLVKFEKVTSIVPIKILKCTANKIDEPTHPIPFVPQIKQLAYPVPKPVPWPKMYQVP